MVSALVFKMQSNLLLILVLVVFEIDCDKILVIPAKDSGSHLASMMKYIIVLVEHGHQVHLLDTAFEKPKYHHPNLTTHTAFVPMELSGFDPWSIVSNDPRRFGVSNIRKDVEFQKMIEHHRKTLEHLLDTSWDLVVIDCLFNPHGYSIAMRLKSEQQVPFILFDTSGVMMTIAAVSMGLARSPVTQPHSYPRAFTATDGVYNPTLFFNRLYNSIYSTYEVILYNLFVQNLFMPTINKFGVDFSWKGLYEQAEFTLVDSFNSGLKFPTTEMAHLVNIGAQCKIIPDQPVSEQVLKFVDDPNSKGTIYIAFGSYVKWDKTPATIVQAFTETIRRLPEYRIVFVHNGQNTSLPPLSNVLYVSWTNQVALLKHPKTKAFISHGGLKSLKESICCEIPIIMVPLFAEQPYNAHVTLANGCGSVINKFTMRTDDLFSIVKVIEDFKWAAQVKQIKAILLDKPITSLELALHYTRRATHSKKLLFKPKSMRQSWATFFYYEIWASLIITVLLIGTN